MNRLKLLFFAAALAWGGCTLSAQTKVIAHRGSWDCEGTAKNSIAALQKAAEARVYGSEFDVSITSDGVPVVNHDDNIEGYVIEDTPYETIRFIKLKNGETLPTLQAYLEAGKRHPDLQLILEIKPHKKEENENRSVTAIVKMVKELGLEKQVEYISFSMNICKQLVSQAPGSQVAYLKSDIAPAEIKKEGMTGIDYHFMVFEKYPEWVADAHKERLTVNVWTVNKEDAMKSLIDLKVDFITTDKPLEALELTQ